MRRAFTLALLALLLLATPSLSQSFNFDGRSCETGTTGSGLIEVMVEPSRILTAGGVDLLLQARFCGEASGVVDTVFFASSGTVLPGLDLEIFLIEQSQCESRLGLTICELLLENWPASRDLNGTFTWVVSTDDGSGNASLTIDIPSGDIPLGPEAVNLGTAGDFVILSKAGISTTGTTLITGDIGVSPIAQTALTGFSETLDSSNEFSTSDFVVGRLFAADYLGATPTKLTTAVSDMETAFTDAAGRTNPTATELGAGDISGMTITPGLYKWGTGLMIDSSGVTLSGSGAANDVWIFQIAEDLIVANGAIITLSGGAQAKNIFWQVTGQTTLGTTSNFRGNILCATAIVFNTGATLNGRALSQTAVTLDANAVTKPN